MVTIVMRAVGALLALAGLALTVVGVWFATQLGGSGTAQFTLRPQAGRPVLITPEVLNRVDADVTVSATAAGSGRVWMARANPSDATAVIGDAQRVEVTGVDVRAWTLRSVSRGNGEAQGLGTADLWRQQVDGTGTVSVTAEQAQAPESIVVAAEGGRLSSLTLTVADKRWFVEAVVAALVGLFLLVAGVVALWPRHRRSAAAPVVADAPAAPVADSADVASDHPRTDHPSTAPTTDSEEATR